MALTLKDRAWGREETQAAMLSLSGSQTGRQPSSQENYPEKEGMEKEDGAWFGMSERRRVPRGVRAAFYRWRARPGASSDLWVGVGGGGQIDGSEAGCDAVPPPPLHTVSHPVRSAVPATQQWYPRSPPRRRWTDSTQYAPPPRVLCAHHPPCITVFTTPRAPHAHGTGLTLCRRCRRRHNITPVPCKRLTRTLTPADLSATWGQSTLVPPPARRPLPPPHTACSGQLAASGGTVCMSLVLSLLHGRPTHTDNASRTGTRVARDPWGVAHGKDGQNGGRRPCTQRGMRSKPRGAALGQVTRGKPG